MLTNLRYAIMIALVLITCATSYISYDLYGSNTTLQGRVDELLVINGRLKDDYSKLETSCEITNKATSELQATSQEMTGKLTELVEALGNIDREEVKHESPKSVSVQSTGVQSTTDLQRLLDEAYCAADPNSAYCTARDNAAGTSSK